MFRASPSRLSVYQKCPWQYKCIYIDKIAEQFKTPKPYLTMGAHVHNALYDFYEKVESDRRNFKTLEQIFRKRWRENRSGFRDRDEERKYGIEALQMLRLFVHKMDFSRKPVMLEDFYDARLDQDITLAGRIDRVDDETEGLHIIDYKTGRLPQGTDPELSAQLLMYSLIIARNSGKPVIRASGLFLRNFHWFTIEPDDDDLQEALEQIRRQVSIIESDKQFQANPGVHCRFCDFIQICPKKDEAMKFVNKEYAQT